MGTLEAPGTGSVVAAAWALLLVGAVVPLTLAVAPDDPAACSGLAPLPPCNRWASRLPVGPANEVHIAVDPTDPLHLLVVGKDYGLGASGVCNGAGVFHVASASYVTFDGGVTWDVTRVPAPYPGDPQPSPLPNQCGSDPVALIGADGTAYFVLLNMQYPGGRRASIGVARSPDGGVTWPQEDIRLVHSSPGDDKEWGAVDSEGRVHLAWADLTAGLIRYARSTTDYQFPFGTSSLGAIGAGNPAVTVHVGPDDEVYAIWRTGNSILFRRSLDHGASFEPARTAFAVSAYETGAAPRLPFMPQVAVDASPTSPFSGRIYVAWPDARDGDANVYMASSGDGGLTWTAARRVDDNVVAGKRQIMPTVSVAPNGRVDIAWLDERDMLPAPVPSTLRAYAASSVDAGTTWSANRAVSDVPLVAQWSKHQNGDVFIGDYMGIASTNDFAWPAFPGNGAARLLEGLPPDKFQRADATTAPVTFATMAPAQGATAPPGVVASTFAEQPALFEHVDTWTVLD